MTINITKSPLVTQSCNGIHSKNDTHQEPKDVFGRLINRKMTAIFEAGLQRLQPLKWVSWSMILMDENLPNDHQFDWSNHVMAFQNSQTICVYIAICDGLCKLAKTSRLTLIKIGISRRADVNDRMIKLNTDQYGAICCIDGKWQQDEGFSNWQPVRLSHSTEPAYPSPLEQLQRSLLVTLPETFSVETFDAEL